MFVGLFLAGAVTGAVGTWGGKKLINLVRDNKQKDRELKELKDEVHELRAEMRKQNVN